MAAIPTGLSTRSENTPFQILGPLRINGAPVREMITQTKPRQLIATLLIHANHFVSTEVLTDALWEGRPPKSAGANLRTYMRVLRDCLETTAAPGQIVTLPGGYRMMVSPDNLDVTLAESLAAEGRHLVGSGDRAGGLAILDRACELWQGQPLEDLPICSTWRAWLNRIEQRRTELLHDVLPLHIACGSHRRAVALARDALGRDPLSEDLWCHVIEGLHAAGQPAEARRAFEECRQLLAAELGVEPGAKLAAAAARLATDPPAATTPPAPAARKPVGPCQLPPSIPDFTGRTEALRQIVDVICPRLSRRPPVVVISGPPGVGKSTLALHTAHSVRRHFPDGQLFLDMRGVSGARTPGDALAEMLRGIGISSRAMPEDPDRRAAMLRSELADRRVLMLLDDAASAAQVAPLIPGTGASALLITSRRRLSGVLATAHIELDVLDPPEAAELLTHLVGTERASAEPAERDSVVAACGRLPLAIRVAAGRVILRPDLTLGRLAERLRGDRVLDELTGDLSSDQGVRASAEQSYRLLSPDEARGYRLLGALGTADCPAWVFDALAGPSTADRMIDGLVDAHLVRLIPGDGAAAPLVRTHHLLRSHAEEHARAHPETARDVAAVLAGWIDTSLQCARGLPFRYFGVRLPASTGRAYGGDGWFDAMRDHLVPMLRVAVERGLTEQAWVLAAAWASYFDLRGEYALWEQAHQTVLPALEQPGHEAGRAVLLRELGQVALYRDDLDLAEQRLCASVDLFGSIGHRDGEGVARIGLGTLCRVRNLDDQAIEHYSTALEAFVATGNREGEAVARNATALIMLRRGQLDEAQRWLAEAFQLAVETDDEHRQAQVRRRIAILCRANGDLAAGQKELEEALRIFQALCDDHCAAYARIALGEMCLEAGDHARAHQLFVDSLSIGRELGDITSQAEAYQGLGEVGLTAGRRQTAQRYFAQAVRSWQLASNPAAAARAQARLDEL